MKVRCNIMALALGLGMVQVGIAQAPASAPSGSTGVCKDGSYTNAASKLGACHGHKGVQSWFGEKPAKAAKSSAANPTSASTPAAAPANGAKAPVSAAPVSAASKGTKASIATGAAAVPGGGPGMVWVNTSTNVYHCSGTKYYGKTKAGKYMTEAEAKAAGAHPDHGKACGQ